MHQRSIPIKAAVLCLTPLTVKVIGPVLLLSAVVLRGRRGLTRQGRSTGLTVVLRLERGHTWVCGRNEVPVSYQRAIRDGDTVAAVRKSCLEADMQARELETLGLSDCERVAHVLVSRLSEDTQT